jgi:hypothetical protein
MFKKCSLLALALLLYSTLSAQSTERTVLANAGGSTAIPSGHTVTWTLGESFVATRASATSPVLLVTEGFQQPTSGTVPTLDLPDAAGQVTVSPNPADDALRIALSEPPAMPLLITLLDLNGRILREEALSDLATTLDLRGLPAALYILRLTDSKGWLRAIQVVKL